MHPRLRVAYFARLKIPLFPQQIELIPNRFVVNNSNLLFSIVLIYPNPFFGTPSIRNEKIVTFE